MDELDYWLVRLNTYIIPQLLFFFKSMLHPLTTMHFCFLFLLYRCQDSGQCVNVDTLILKEQGLIIVIYICMAY